VGPDSEHAQPDGSLGRASDADRDRTVETLAAASAEGRLNLAEYSQRSEAALLARTLGELTSLTADLPAPPQRDAAPIPAEITAEITAVLGNESRKGLWVVPAHLAVRSVLGDCHLEMHQAVISQRVTTIDATVRFGSVTIFVPDGIDVRMNGRAVLGAKSSQLHGEPQPRSARDRGQLRCGLRSGHCPRSGLAHAKAACSPGQLAAGDQLGTTRSAQYRTTASFPRSQHGA
jgi:hypothetical protein